MRCAKPVLPKQLQRLCHGSIVLNRTDCGSRISAEIENESLGYLEAGSRSMPCEKENARLWNPPPLIRRRTCRKLLVQHANSTSSTIMYYY
jgi:hypothetical protein